MGICFRVCYLAFILINYTLIFCMWSVGFKSRGHSLGHGLEAAGVQGPRSDVAPRSTAVCFPAPGRFSSVRGSGCGFGLGNLSASVYTGCADVIVIHDAISMWEHGVMGGWNMAKIYRVNYVILRNFRI